MSEEQEEKKPRMLEVAIVKVGSCSRCDGNDSFDEYIAKSITDWDKITEEQYKALCHFQSMYDYWVIVRKSAEEIIPQAVKEYVAWIEKRQADAVAEEKRRQEAKLARAASSVKKKKNQLEKLAKELGVVMAVDHTKTK